MEIETFIIARVVKKQPYRVVKNNNNLFGDNEMVRQLTKNLYDALMFDTGPGAAAITDFGLGHSGSEQHTVLQRAVRAGATAEELDKALGNGERIAKLVKDYTEIETEFHTAWDDIREETLKQIKELEIKRVITDDERLQLDELYEAIKTL